MLGGNGVLLENHVIRHIGDLEVIHTYQGTEPMQTLIVGRDISGVGAFRVSWERFVVRVAGLRVRVARTGSGPPLVLVTGIGANLDMWEPFVGLVPCHEVITFDPPGAGGSQGPLRPHRMPGLAAIVVSLLDELGLELGEVDVTRSEARSPRNWHAARWSASAA